MWIRPYDNVTLHMHNIAQGSMVRTKKHSFNQGCELEGSESKHCYIGKFQLMARELGIKKTVFCLLPWSHSGMVPVQAINQWCRSESKLANAVSDPSQPNNLQINK